VTYKEGDILLCGCKQQCGGAIIIIDPVPEGGDDDDDGKVVWYRSPLEGDCWTYSDSFNSQAVIRATPHPDPDRILAEFTAWRLTNAAS
jgi:hypothetical protein